MEESLELNDLSLSHDEKNKVLSSYSNPHRSNVTEEEFQNFVHRVTEVEKIVNQLASTDVDEQKRGMLLADQILNKKVVIELSEIGELKVKTNRTIINKRTPEDSDPSEMSQAAFMRGVEQDAKARAEDRKARNERAETYKTIGNAAFRAANYEKAITYFGKALEQRKDSAVLWNNRALAYMRLGLHEKALLDCDWALRVNRANIKALLNSAKCHKVLGNDDKCREFVERARKKNPHFLSYISEFERNLETETATGEAANESVD